MGTASFSFTWGQLCWGTASHGDSIIQLHMGTALLGDSFTWGQQHSVSHGDSFAWGQLCMGTASHGDSIIQLHMQTASHLCAEDVALMVVKALHQTGVIPVLNGIVGAIMDLHLYSVAPIVDQEDDWVQPVPDHG